MAAKSWCGSSMGIVFTNLPIEQCLMGIRSLWSLGSSWHWRQSLYTWISKGPESKQAKKNNNKQKQGQTSKNRQKQGSKQQNTTTREPLSRKLCKKNVEQLHETNK